MKLKHLITIICTCSMMSISAQSIGFGPLLEAGNFPNLGVYTFIKTGDHDVRVDYNNNDFFESPIYPGFLANWYLANGMVIDLNAKFIQIGPNYPISSPFLIDKFYNIRTGIEVFLPLKRISNEKIKMYYGAGLGYEGRKIAIKGMDDFEGFKFERYSIGMYFTGHFRIDMNLTDWFTLSPRANLLLNNFGKEESREKSADLASFNYDQTNRLIFDDTPFNPSLSISAILRIKYFKKD